LRWRTARARVFIVTAIDATACFAGPNLALLSRMVELGQGRSSPRRVFVAGRPFGRPCPRLRRRDRRPARSTKAASTSRGGSTDGVARKQRSVQATVGPPGRMPGLEASASGDGLTGSDPSLLRRHPAVPAGPGARNGRVPIRAKPPDRPRGPRAGRYGARYLSQRSSPPLRAAYSLCAASTSLRWASITFSAMCAGRPRSGQAWP